MSACGYYPYTLPAIDFVGGSSQDLIFHVYFYTTKNPFDLSDCTANFSIVEFTNRTGKVVLSKTMTIDSDGAVYSGDTYRNILRVALTPADTVNLSGKYIYQISIKETSTGKTEVPNQGTMYITNNINKDYITGA